LNRKQKKDFPTWCPWRVPLQYNTLLCFDLGFFSSIELFVFWDGKILCNVCQAYHESQQHSSVLQYLQCQFFSLNSESVDIFIKWVHVKIMKMQKMNIEVPKHQLLTRCWKTYKFFPRWLGKFTPFGEKTVNFALNQGILTQIEVKFQLRKKIRLRQSALDLRNHLWYCELFHHFHKA